MRDEPSSETWLNLCPDTRPEHRLPVPRACELPSRPYPQRVPRRPQRPPPTRSLLRVVRRHSPNPQLRRSIIPANLPIAPPIPLSVLVSQISPHPGSDSFLHGV